MNITELSVKRPTAIIMLMVLFVGLGLIGYMNLGADLLPSANTPVISILVTYPGAGSEEIEKDVVKPLEDAVAGLNGIDRVRSYAGDGYGHVILQFTMSSDVDSAVIDVQKALERVSDELPAEASRPVMTKYDINMKPALIISISGGSTYEELSGEADLIKRSIEKLPGVGGVTLQGNYEKELSVVLDKTLVDYYGISINTILSMLKANNMNIPAGDIEQQDRDLTVRLTGEFQSLDEVRDLRIPITNGGTVRLGDLAKVSLDYPEPDELVKLSGKTSIGISVQKQSNTNIVEVADRVKAELENVRKTLPKGMSMVIASDSTKFINSSLDEAGRNVLEGILTTAIVLFLFLRRWRSSLIVLVAIPISLVATLFMMYVLKFTLNLVSLMGLAMSVGILVDDSIVILENIHRHISLGEDPKKAAIEGRREIGLAAIAITLCDVVVFAPVAFMGDIVGQFFKEFGLTVVFATLFSLLVSFTLTPMLASRMFKSEGAPLPDNGLDEAGASGLQGSKSKSRGRFSAFFDRNVKRLYCSFLEWSLDHRWVIISIIAIGVVLSVLLIPLKAIGTEFMPVFDQSRLSIDVKLTPGSSLRQTDDKVREVEKYLGTLPEVRDYFTLVGSNGNKAQANVTVNLSDKNERSKTQSQLAEEIRKWGRGLTGAEVSVTEPNIVDRTSIDGTKPVILNLTGYDADVLRKLSEEVEQAARTLPGVVDVENSARSGKNEINIKLNRLAASEYGITAYDAAAVLRTAIQGTDAGVYRANGDEYDLVLSFNKDQVKTPYDIGSIRLTGQGGQQVYLSQVASIVSSDSQGETMRLNRQQVVTIAANIEGRILGDVNGDIREKLKTVAVPKGCSIEFGGDQNNMATSFDSLIKALIVSVLLVYMILVVLYESFLTPLIRMMSLPCGIIGALGALALTGKSLNLLSMIGLIMLDGLVSKNGTLLIDYTNTLMKRGLPLREALLKAGATRLRPIIMTSVTMIVGMSPLALSIGDGSEVKSGMAVALIGGLITSTVLSPILLPVVYTMLNELKMKLGIKREFKRRIEA